VSDSLSTVALGSDAVRWAADEVDRLATYRALGVATVTEDAQTLWFNSEALEIVALRLARRDFRSAESRRTCREAFDLTRGLIQVRPGDDADTDLERLRRLAKGASLGLLADLPAQVRQILDDLNVDNVIAHATDWADRLERSVLCIWLLLYRKRDWSDIDLLHATLAALRSAQAQDEPVFLESHASASDSAWRLVAFYHLLRAAEIVAQYLELGDAAGRFDPIEQAETHFDRAQAAAERGSDVDLVFHIRVFDVAARQLIDNSIWRVTRGAGVRASAFAQALVSRDRTAPFLELLPPQRRALVEEGLIGTGRRSIVVSLPTSAGKTLIAEFRILQALDRYESVGGWCAYTAPTRALVNQITARLRRDLGPLNIRVERVSPALEVDSIEEEILTSEIEAAWRVLVTTPEKLDLLLRGGWAQRVDRPLSLVIVDEAHNLGSGVRGLRLELLLATINREAREASFMLLTPFVPNAEEIAAWLDPLNSQAVELGLEWLPNDRVIGLSRLEKGTRSGDSRILARTVNTSAASLFSSEDIQLAEGRPLGKTWSKLKSPGYLAAATAETLTHRGATVVLVQRPDHSWSIAEALADRIEVSVLDNAAIASVQGVLAAEYGADFPLVKLVGKGVAVHHAGVADEVRQMLEVLAEQAQLRYIVATTTLAEGINFPIANVVMATNQYPYGVTMPPEDFWNIAGRAGRADHGQPGVVLLSAPTDERAATLEQYVHATARSLTSTLIAMVQTAVERFGSLDLARLSFYGDWSSFVQFIAHTYRMVGADEFAVQVENVLRGTLGYRRLRDEHPNWAAMLLDGVRAYSDNLRGKPLSLVDATGFSIESVGAALARMRAADVQPITWDTNLFDAQSSGLRDAIGVLLRVPELREQLVERLEPSQSDGDFLARIVKDWVGGTGLAELAASYFTVSADGKQRDPTSAITTCCQRLFGSILPAVSWGLSALQALSLGRLPSDEDVDPRARDLSSFVFYGVKTREAVALRLFGVPRGAAPALAAHLAQSGAATSQLRTALTASTEQVWRDAMGDVGTAYYRAWRLVEPAA